jgi:lipid-binding SYLF domain-containing protein
MKTTGLMVLAFCASAAAQGLGTSEVRRINDAAAVLKEIRGVPEKDIPASLWTKAKCVAVVPGLKRAAFIVGGEYGKGLVSCRTANGGWSPPVFIKIQKGSWGAQIGGEEVDLVLLVMNDRGMEHLLKNKVTLGTQASVAAGPLGRDVQAATDAAMRAEILSWSRSRGVFAGVNLSGGVVSPDEDDNRDLYGGPVNPHEILVEAKMPSPPAALSFLDELKQHDAVARTSK